VADPLIKRALPGNGWGFRQRDELDSTHCRPEQEDYADHSKHHPRAWASRDAIVPSIAVFGHQCERVVVHRGSRAGLPSGRNEHQLTDGHPRLDIGMRPGDILEGVFLHRRRLNYPLFDPLTQVGNEFLEEIRPVEKIA
jgi:hypothetical protein